MGCAWPSIVTTIACPGQGQCCSMVFLMAHVPMLVPPHPSGFLLSSTHGGGAIDPVVLSVAPGQEAIAEYAVKQWEVRAAQGEGGGNDSWILIAVVWSLCYLGVLAFWLASCAMLA